MEHDDKALEEIAKEYATYYPEFVADKLEVDDVSVETVQVATEKVVCPLILASFVMTLNQKGAQQAHEWFMSIMAKCGQAIENDLNERGMNTKVDVTGTFIHREKDESNRWG